MFEWHTHLCDYYNVTPKEALALGTRSNGRKPSLPGSPTCKPVSGKTFEDIWDEKERKTTQQVFDFYKDQGAWSAFRQCVRHSTMEKLHIAYFKFLLENNIIKNGSHICEYGAGVAPFVTSFLKYIQGDVSNFEMKITIVDVDCEHLNFAKYRLNCIKKEKGFHKVDLDFQIVKPDRLPVFDKKIDALFCFEVLEHVPSPVAVIENIRKSMNPGAIYIENFIKHEVDEDEDDGPDLISARNERDKYYEVVHEYYNLMHPTPEESKSNPSVTRIWQRNSLT